MSIVGRCALLTEEAMAISHLFLRFILSYIMSGQISKCRQGQSIVLYVSPRVEQVDTDSNDPQQQQTDGWMRVANLYMQYL